jgi:hypothetical protein
MRVVYEAENLVDAHLVRGVLEQAGIPVWVRGEYLTGAMGELPVMGLVAVCVPESAFAQARPLVEELADELARPVALADPQDEPGGFGDHSLA